MDTLFSDESLSDFMEEYEKGLDSSTLDDSQGQGGSVGSVWGPVGGVAGFLVAFAGFVAVLKKYWGSFEALTQSITRLFDAISNRLNARRDAAVPSPAPPRMPRNLSDDEIEQRLNAQRIALEAQGSNLRSVENHGHYENATWI